MQPNSTACCPPAPFTIFTGDAKTMALRVASTTGLPIDLTTCTEIVVNLPNADGSYTQLKLSGMSPPVAIVSPAILGQFTALISSVNSAKLAIGEFQNIDVTFTIGGNALTVRFYAALSVFETT